MNQTDKNIALAKECGAIYKEAHRTYVCGYALVMYPYELDEYTSRVCAELNRKILEQQATFHVNMLRAWPEKSHDEIANAITAIGGSKELDKLLAEKDALIAMQADALSCCIILEDGSQLFNVNAVEEALAATAETVEAWKNRQGYKK